MPLLAELAQAGGAEDLRRVVVYIATTTQDSERWRRFAEAVRRQVPGGGELMNQTQKMIEIYGDVREHEGRQEGRHEGRHEGELRGKVQTIEGFVARDVPWSIIEAATGFDQVTFHRLKHRLDAADRGASDSN